MKPWYRSEFFIAFIVAVAVQAPFLAWSVGYSQGVRDTDRIWNRTLDSLFKGEAL
jgi:hypothetical protein